MRAKWQEAFLWKTYAIGSLLDLEGDTSSSRCTMLMMVHIWLKSKGVDPFLEPSWLEGIEPQTNRDTARQLHEKNTKSHDAVNFVVEATRLS